MQLPIPPPVQMAIALHERPAQHGLPFVPQVAASAAPPSWTTPSDVAPSNVAPSNVAPSDKAPSVTALSENAESVADPIVASAVPPPASWGTAH
jgi:hypothetical protein